MLEYLLGWRVQHFKWLVFIKILVFLELVCIRFLLASIQSLQECGVQVRELVHGPKLSVDMSLCFGHNMKYFA